jgi:predicted GNAT family acetyltransferase
VRRCTPQTPSPSPPTSPVACGRPPAGTPGDAIGQRIDAAALFVWEVDGTVVSMAAVTAPLGGVSRVHLVYTPPEHRGRGYASACVATLTAGELAHHGRTCMLYADLANPTSNGIYQAIGYRRVGDAVDLKFAPLPRG